jgi:hypothetical protein
LEHPILARPSGKSEGSFEKSEESKENLVESVGEAISIQDGIDSHALIGDQRDLPVYGERPGWL